jgi:hypothetical protein
LKTHLIFAVFVDENYLEKLIKIKHDGSGIWKVGAFCVRNALLTNPQSMRES